MTKITEPPVDNRIWRQVTSYDDHFSRVVEERRAVDVLECGHRVDCSRTPGGRTVVAHTEPCGTCTVDAP